ncbi:MAG: mycofactocin-associated electron transfer flavoprotein beta subunit [Actinomycetota bacterium]
MTIVACLKWVSHPGEPDDARFSGMSPADQAALEFALLQAQALGDTVVAVTLGPAGADRVLRDALACGAARAVRIDAPITTAGHDVAAAIAHHVVGASFLWCGDHSLDLGAGAVPAFLAAHLGAEQALGVIHAVLGDGEVHATRRLDGGWREVLAVRAPAVISVEGATARLRRASLPAVRAAASAPIEVVAPSAPVEQPEFIVRPYRPRARALPPPAGQSPLERLRVLTDAGAAAAARGEQLTLEPAAAAARIVQALREWGHLGE